MNWLKKLFDKEEPLRVYVTDQRTPEQEVMYKERLAIQAMLGMERGDDHQNWLRLHQIMLDHENRIKALEGIKMKNDTEAGAPEGIYSVNMTPSSLTFPNGADRAADRLWLAGMAMQAMIRDDRDMYSIARQSWAMADRMLEVEDDA